MLKYHKLWKDHHQYLKDIHRNKKHYDQMCYGRRFPKNEFPELHEQTYANLKKSMLDNFNPDFGSDVFESGNLWSKLYMNEKNEKLY